MCKVRRPYLIFLFALILFVPAIDACICDVRPPVCSEYWDSTPIFIGSISNVTRTEDSVHEVVYVKVEEVFRGMGFPFAHTYNYGHSCSFTFAEGSSYLFYADIIHDKPNTFGSSLCSRTAGERDPRFIEDLAFLRAVKAGKTHYWIWGTVTDIGRDIPFSGIKVSVLNQKMKIEGFSNDSGDVKLEVPSPGDYVIRVHLPPKTTDFNYSIPNDMKRFERQRNQIVRAKLNGKNRYVDYKVNVVANRCGWFEVAIPKTRTYQD